MSNLKETVNKVRIEGILAETNIDYKTYDDKNGNKVEAIAGEFQVLVRTNVDGVPKDLMIPVRVFSNKLTGAGKPNPAYASIEKVKNEFVSIAAAGGEEKATKVRITNGKLSVNEYPDATGRIVSYPRITASFISEANGNFNPEATFDIVMVVDSIREVVDKDGVPMDPEQLSVHGSIVQYNGSVDCIELVANLPSTITGIRDYWNVGDTVRVGGKLNFTYSVVEVQEQVAFGEATKKQTRRVSELVIVNGTPAFEGDAAIDPNELEIGKKERLARLENLKSKENSKPKQTPAPSDSYSTDDLGF